MEKKELLVSYGVDVDKALEFWGDIESFNESLKEFKDSLEDKLNNIKYYKNSNDWNNYGILAHSMKSEAKYLGFMNDAEVFLEHELKGKASDKDFIDKNFGKLEDTINKILKLLVEYFGMESKKKSILVADDSNIIINYIENNIGEEFQILRANTGKEAIERIENNEIYAILLDLNMPTLNGFEVLDYMRDKNKLDAIPVVVITGDDTEETIKKAFSYQILDVLNKPFKDENIKRVISSIKSYYEKN